MDIIPLWPSKFELTEKRQRHVTTAYNFWNRLVIGGFLFITMAFVIGFVLLSQLFSMDVGGSGGADIISFVIGVFLSWVSISALKFLQEAHTGYINVYEDRVDDLSLYNRSTLIRFLFLSLMSWVATLMFWSLSRNLGTYSIPTVYAMVRAGEHTWIDLVMSGLYQLMYVGSVMTMLSYVALLRYQFYTPMLKFRVWLTRLRLWLFTFLFSSEGPISEESTKPRCSMCWRDSLEPDPANEEVICSFCGYPFRFEIEPVQASAQLREAEHAERPDSTSHDLGAPEDD